METQEGTLSPILGTLGILAITRSRPCSLIIDWGDGQLDLWSLCLVPPPLLIVLYLDLLGTGCLLPSYCHVSTAHA